MPSLFNRRSRSVSTSRPVTPASSSAHVAAAQAFLANRQSQGNLSASAAAAALRSMSPTPTPIDQIQTKRMLNRQASNASVGNATRGRSRPTLQRKPSSGSMTERTFRSPSPGRSSTPQINYTSSAPPVPPLPQTFVTEDVPPIPRRSHRRSMSLENFSTRVVSPPPAKKQAAPQRNISASNIAAAAATRSASLRQANDLERPDSRNSYNFSYPRGSRPNSPPPQISRGGPPVATNHPVSARANGISASEVQDIQNTLNKTAAKPVKKKKKRPVTENGEGSHLQEGSVNHQAIPSTKAQDIAAQDTGGAQHQQKRTKKKPKAAVLSGEHSHFPENDRGDQDALSTTTSDQGQEQRAQRPTGTLVKQPSVVKEEFKDGEDEVQQSIETQSSSVSAGASIPRSAKPARKVQSKKSTTEANMSRKIEDNSRGSVHANVTTPPPAQPKKGLAPHANDTSNGRQSSISPSRSFRFSDRIASDLTAGRKHDPLPRSVSPAKSALKHHSPSRSDNSPTEGTFPHRRGSSVAPSESSEVSVDVAARKKANRVSFEATPEIVGAATGSDVAAQGPKDGAKRSWFGKSKKPSPLSKTSMEDDSEEGMKPRPVLPSFGSVRKNQSESSPSPASRKLDAASSSTASLSEVSSGADDYENAGSSDHAIGNVLASHKGRSGEHSLPRKVTSVEGTGYESDSESLSSDEDEDVVVQQSTAGQIGTPAEASTAGPATESHDDQDGSVVPAIEIQPATPGLDISEQKGEWIEAGPGQLPGAPSSGSAVASAGSDHANMTENANVGLGLASTNEAEDTDLSESSANEHRLNTIEEESDDNSLYDDAPEDSSEIDGIGYGSINAIVDSSVVNSSPPSRPLDSQDSPAAVVNESKELSWEKSQAYWSGVSQKLKDEAKVSQQNEPENGKDSPEGSQSQQPQQSRAGLQPAAEIVSRPKQKKKGSFNSATTSQASSGNGSSSIQPVSHEVPPIPNRNGARTSGPNTFRHSMREETSTAPSLRPRPQSMVGSFNQSSAKNQLTAQKKQSALVKPTPSKLSRTFSNDSDSDSSFKRARARKPAGSGFSRRTMRSGGSAGENAPSRAERDVRSLSPVNRQPLSPSGPSRMRTSMRGAQGGSGPTLRNQPEEKRSSSLFSKARKTKSPSRPTSSLGFKSKSQSRFADSDDEGDAAPSSYRSRYDDSSDEDELEALRPVRGIPKRIDEGDSTDLEDSSDDQRRTGKPSTPKRKLEVKVPVMSSPVASEPMSPATAKKKGFWGRLRGKKDREPNAQFTITERNKQSPIVNGNTPVKDRDTEDAEAKNAAQLGFSSAAERDALVEQMMKKLEAAQEQNSTAQSTSQKRLTPQRVLSDSWPLPPKLTGIPEDRPVTSAGAGEPSRPGMGERQPTSETLRTAGGTAIYGRNGKKKKFPRLRRAFGLTD